MNIVKFLRLPKNQLILLFIFILLSVFFRYSLRHIPTLLLSVGITVFLDLVLLKVRRIPLFFPSAGAVTGIIIGLLVSPAFPWYVVVLASFLAVFSKQFIRYKSKHIFNPAAFGIFFSHLLFSRDVSWWGVSFQQLNGKDLWSIVYFVLLILPVLISGLRLKRYITMSFFIMVYITSSIFIGGNVSNPIALFTDPTFIFFIVVMLPEPMTTPSKINDQVLFGLFVGFLTLLFSYSRLPFIPDPLIAALLLGNVAYTFRKVTFPTSFLHKDRSNE